ncbi:MAG TPA: TRAP transporter substrate-binding protein [Candidatus Acidoferrum sp.]|nr:TRAP transporter substrate-binding protein [Candidatus Acidoferrum sp.]
MLTRRSFLIRSAALGLGMTAISRGKFARAAEARTFTFGHDQPADTAYGFCAEQFDKKLAELSGGTMRVRHFPGAALGEEPVMAQKVRQGDIDFAINSTANTSTAVPQSGVFSLHFVFRDEPHLARIVNDPTINGTFKKMITDNVQGAFSLGLMSLGMRNMYAKFTISGLADVTGKKVRVQATKTEDAFFGEAYKATPVHMPFGQVFTSLQTGLVQIAENGNDNYLKAKHYEAAPVLSKTEHEANNFHLWMSQKTWDGLNEQQRKWVMETAEYVRPLTTNKALEFAGLAVKTLQGLGVKWHDQVDKNSMMKVATPLQDSLAKELGPYAVQLLNLFRNVK